MRISFSRGRHFVRWGILGLAFCVTPGVTACHPQQPAPLPASALTNWRFAIEEVQGSVQDTYARRFKELIEQKSDGAIAVTVYPYGSLGTSDQVTELLHMGAIQFAMASPGHLGKLIPEIQLLLLHFVFSDHNEVNKRVLGGSVALRDRFDTLYREKGLHLLALYPEGWQVWTTNKLIRRPADFTGFKMRVMTSPILVEAYKAYGANPTPLPYGEVYSALQLRMIDGQVNPIFAIEEMSFYEVTDYLIFARHAQFITSVVTNPRFFAALSPETQDMVRDTIGELHEYIFAVQEEFNARRLEEIKEKKPHLSLVYLTAEERERFKAASLPVRQKYIDMVGHTGTELLAILLSEVASTEEQVSNHEEAAAEHGVPRSFSAITRDPHNLQ